MKHHYKKFLIAFFFLFRFSFLNAQWVAIPDSNFVNWLQMKYPICMNGNLMDTTCWAVVGEDSIYCQNYGINDLDGIQYFDSLKVLACSNSPQTPPSKKLQNITAFPPLLKCFYSWYNAFTTLPNLPDSLIVLSVSQSGLQSLPPLPASLTRLDCGQNYLDTLPNLPSSLVTLDCDNNQLALLPALPSSLTELWCSDNSIDTLPALPPALRILRCYYNQLSFLPVLPPLLNTLICNHNYLTKLPALPDSLRWLECGYNNNLAFPVLNDSLEIFDCRKNGWTSLPALPDSLEALYCYNNQISSFPALPQKLISLGISYNPVINFPALPVTLHYLFCDSINLTSFPASFPPNLYSLSCSHNPLTSLPDFPPSLFELYCTYTTLTSLPALSNSMSWAHIEDNPYLICFPEFQSIQILYWGNTAISCLPNAGFIGTANPPIIGLPLCLSVSPCNFNWSMYGRIYNDTNANCVRDTMEALFKNLRVNLESGGNILQSFIFNTEGYYSFKTNYGNYAIKIDTAGLPFNVTCPPSGVHLSSITALDSTDEDLDFGLVCKPGYFDLIAKSISPYCLFAAGSQNRLFLNAGDASLFYGVSCSVGISGTVQAVLNGPVSYVSPDSGALTPNSVMSNVLTWNIADFSQVDPEKDFNIIVSVDSTANLFDTICMQLSISPVIDNNPLNNSISNCFYVYSSFDPNAKTVYPFGDVDTSVHWLTYTVFFQNTGNATAKNIVITDTLDSNIDGVTFQYLSSSHDPIIQLLPGNIIHFNFPNIYLPDSIADEPHSHGYVQYKVKLKPGLTNGTLIHNTAHIIFDFNSPVTTNTTENQILITTGVQKFQVSNFQFQVVPNPFHDRTVLKIKSQNIFNNYTLEIYNVIGKKVMEKKSLHKNVQGNSYGEIVIERKNLEAGVYIFKLFDDRELKGAGKLVVQ